MEFINRKNLFRLMKFSFIGGIGVGTNYAFLYLFAFMFSTDIKNMFVVVASGIINISLNYFANHYWTFRDKRHGISASIGGLKFFAVTIFSVSIYFLLVLGFNNSGLDPRISVAIAVLISFIPKYLLCYFWVWRTRNACRMSGMQKEV